MRGFEDDRRSLANVERRYSKRAVRRGLRDRKRQRQPGERSGEPQRPAARSERPYHAKRRSRKRKTVRLRQTPERPCGSRQVGERVEHRGQHAMRRVVRKYVKRCGQQDSHQHGRRNEKADPGNRERVGKRPQQWNLENQYAVSGASPSVIAYCTRALDASPRPMRRAVGLSQASERTRIRPIASPSRSRMCRRG